MSQRRGNLLYRRRDVTLGRLFAGSSFFEVDDVKHWTTIRERLLGEYPLITLRERTVKNSLSGAVNTFVVANVADWVNIAAVTRDGNMLLVEQPRAGIDDTTLEIPGGTVDGTEEPLDAAQRELLEETGYVAEEMVYLGKVAVNPALQNNWCHLYLAKGAHKVSEPNPDPEEDITLRIVTVDEVLRMIDAGEIVHSLGVLCVLKALRLDA